jgi:hypothetical protein
MPKLMPFLQDGSTIVSTIKVKHGSAIKCFTENGLRFVDGTELQADIMVISIYNNKGLMLAYSFSGHLDSMRQVCRDEVASKVGVVRGMDQGQLQGVWRHCRHNSLWFGIGMWMFLLWTLQFTDFVVDR